MTEAPRQLTFIHPLFPALPIKGSYRVAEAAKGLGVDRRTIYRAIERGELTVIRLTQRCTRIPAPELEAYITTHILDPHA